MNMQFMREHSNSMLITIMFGIIIVVFAFSFGPGSRGCTTSQPIAGRVNGEAITTGEWSFYYDQLYSYYQRFDPQFNNEKADEYKLKDKAMEQIVDNMLLAQAGHSMGLYISEEEVAKSIIKDPSFGEGEEQDARKFSKDLYRRMVNYYYKMSVTRYEQKRFSDMMGERVRSVLNNGVVISENFAKSEWALDQEKIGLEFVRFNTARGESNTEVSAEEVQKFITDSMPEIEEYYNTNKFEYEKEEQIQVRHILLREPEDADEDAKKSIREKIDSIASMAKQKPETFEALAKANSEDLSNKDKGGDLGYFSRGAMVPDFEEAAFAMKVGDISDPVKTRFGWHVLKLEDKKEAFSKKLDEVKEEIARKLIVQKRASDVVKKEAETFLASLKEGKTFEELVAAANPPALEVLEDAAEPAEVPAPDKNSLKVEKTGPFTRTATKYIPRIGTEASVFDAAWKLSLDKPLAEQVYTAKNGDCFVIKLVEKIEPNDADFETARRNNVDQLAGEFGRQAYQGWLNVARADADIQTNYKAALYNKNTPLDGEF